MSAHSGLQARPAPPRFSVLGPRRIHRSDRCINCGTCIEACTYGCHERSADPRIMADPVADCCRSCFACVLRCPRQALSMHRSEEFEAQGDQTFTPKIIHSTLEQSAEGKVPVSGAGYDGPFSGPGYDGIWTDMSEIVRPTRDGIHGRERISTAVSLGRKVRDICGMHFDDQGNLLSQIPAYREIPYPVILGLPPFSPGGEVTASLALAATRVNSYATVRASDDLEPLREYFNHLILRLDPAELEVHRQAVEWASIVELEPGEDQLAAAEVAHDWNSHLLTMMRLPVAPEAEARAVTLARGGAEIIHLCADRHGRGQGGRSMLECLRACHLAMVEAGLRDQVTLLASGGVAAAEHVPKTILLGADAVVVDLPPLIALECTLCGDCLEGTKCPRKLHEIDRRWGASRIINLLVAWRDQLLEVLGAMGLRDVRRLRGETGRAIFADQALEDFKKRLATKAPHPGTLPEGEETRTVEHELPPRKRVPHRFPVRLGSARVEVDRQLCIHCGTCAESCQLGVHRRLDGRLHLDEPRHDLCLGPTCQEQNDWCCVTVCPVDALIVEPDPVALVLGDKRWTAELLRRTFDLAEHGYEEGLEDLAQPGDSGGGFDVMRLPERLEGVEPTQGPIDLSLPLNRRGVGPKIVLPYPFYGGGMSYGSISLQVMTGRAMAAQALGTFISTGEGGYPEELIPYKDHVITQVATGLFGVREETIQRTPMMEFKYAQGAKPGLGGHLLGAKNTPKVAAMREAVPGTSLFSPFPFHSVYSVEDHKKHLDWMRAINPEVLVSVKVSTPEDVDMVAVGAYHAGANVIHLDGAYGGTGAAPDIAKKNIAMPIEYAVTRVHDFLVAEGIREKVTLIASGGLRTPEDLLKAVALGADGVVIGTAELVAIHCVRCRNCERGRGCPIGIATTDPLLAPQMTSEWVRDRIVNMYRSWIAYLTLRLRNLGMSSIHQLRGRRDLLRLTTNTGRAQR
jgi:glutamate synthase domain-containing protein 2/Fe-S-cluster-containing dehydrogenase component